MKKVLSWVLLLTLCLSLFAGCANQETTPTETPTTEPVVEVDPNGAANALAYVKTMYKNAGEKTPKDFTRIGIVPVGQTKYEVVWTADVAEDLVKAVVLDNGMVTIDVNEATEVDVPYVLTATITGVDGKEHSFSWNHLIPAAMSIEDILKDAYALEKGEALGYEATLRGVVKSVDTPYSEDYKNITVTIACEGFEDKPVMCYRLKGEGVEKIVAGNIITVTGTIKNYNGTIEFDAGCIMDAWEEGNPVVMPTDPIEIVDMAYELPRGSSLPAPVTLTGYITSIDTPYSEQYNNITVTMAIPGRLNKPITCYRMKGADAEVLKALKTSDEITVTGVIKNYEGTREFDTGCQLVKVVPGSGHTQPKDPVKVVEEAYALPLAGNLLYTAELTGKITKINSKYSASYGNITVTIEIPGAEGKPIECYRMTGDGNKLSKLKVGDDVTVRGLIKNYYNFSTKVSKIQYDKPEMVDCKFNSAVVEDEKTAMMPVTDVKVGTAYKFGFQQNNLTDKPWQMINGEMDGYYGATVTAAAQAIDTYLEETADGYYIYTQKGSTKQYINIVVSGTYYNLKYQATPSSVWTLNTQYKYVKTTCTDGTEVYLGTYGQNSTLGASKTSYISDTSKIGVSQFCAYFLEVDPNGGVGGGTTPEQPNAGFVADPKTETAYKLGLQQNGLDGTIYYFTGSEDGNYLATSDKVADAADVYLETATNGYMLYVLNGGVKNYITIEKTTNSSNGKIYYNARVRAAAEMTPSVWKLNKDYKYMTTTHEDGTEVVMGTYGTYTTISCSKSSFISDTSVIGVTQFCAWFLDGTGSTTPDTPAGGDKFVDAPVAGTAYKFGVYLPPLDNAHYYVEGTNDAKYLNTTTDVSGAIDVYYTTSGNGIVLYTLKEGVKYYIDIIPRETDNTKVRVVYLTEAEQTPTVYNMNTQYKYLTTTVNSVEYTLGTYTNSNDGVTYETLSASKSSFLSNPSVIGNTQFPAWFIDPNGSGSTTPDTPSTSDTAALLTDKPVAGDVIVIVNSDKAMGAASGNKMSGVDAAVTGTSLAVTADMLQLTVAVEGENYMFISDGKYLTSGETGNSMGLSDSLTDCGKWTLEAADTGTWYIKNVGANYNGNYNQAMEYFSGFTTYGIKTTDIYKMQLFKVGTGNGGSTGGDDSGSTTMTPEQIVNAAYALAEGESMAEPCTLTGVICSVDKAYDAAYNNVTVTIIVGNLTDKAIQCYRMKGTGADVIKVGDTITVTGTLKNYYGTIEFDAGCTLDSYVAGTAPEVAEPDANIVFDDTSKRTTITTEQQVWQQNGITVTNDKSGATSNINGEYFNPIRLYKSTSVTVAYTKAMTKIEFVCGNASYATALANSISGAEVKVVGTTVTVTLSSASSSFTIAAMGAQARVSEVKVYC